MDRADIEQLQMERLQATLNRVYKNVSHYRQLFRQMDFLPEDLNGLHVFSSLPLTTRRDLMNNYPYGMFAVPLREVVRLLSPALTLNKPVVTGFTANDLERWAELMARNLTAVGVGKDDVVQISLNFGMVAGPFGVQLGAEKIGASVIPASGTNPSGQLKIMRDFRTTTLVSTPTFAMQLVRAMGSAGIESKTLSLKFGVFGSEPWPEEMRKQIEESLHMTATDVYGLGEIFGPGVAWECPEKNGLHIPEDHFFPEIIDPVTLKPQPEGVEGELVITTLTKEAFPLVRFRTGDITTIDKSACACGRTHSRIARIFKRSDDIIVMRGVSIIPEQIGLVLERIYRSVPHYQLVVERKDHQDQLTAMIEISDRFFFDEMKKQRRFVERLHRELSEFLGWEIDVKLVEPGTFDRSRKVIDKRQF
ncbi:MAG: phenylacetate--CoA ligase [Desulfobacterales bacterium]